MFPYRIDAVGIGIVPDEMCIRDRALERHILSRDFLRKNDWARLKYQQMKYDMAEQANQDRKKYQALKEQYINDFIDSIIAEEKRIRNTEISIVQ